MTRAQPWTTPNNYSLSGYSGATTSCHCCFNVISGVIKTYSGQPDHNRHIVGFWFAYDLVGLAENGKYSKSAAAVTDVTAYRIPTIALATRLRKHPGLDFQIIAKLCHDLREAQRHAILLSKRSATAKIGFFIQMLETAQADHNDSTAEVYLPMSRLDIAAYVAISPEAVSRSFRELVDRGAISVRDRHHLKIIDREQLGNGYLRSLIRRRDRTDREDMRGWSS